MAVYSLKETFITAGSIIVSEFLESLEKEEGVNFFKL